MRSVSFSLVALIGSLGIASVGCLAESTDEVEGIDVGGIETEHGGHQGNPYDPSHYDSCQLMCITIQRGAFGFVEDSEVSTAGAFNKLGANKAMRTGINQGGTSYSLLWFDLSFIPQTATVLSATVGVYSLAATAKTVNVHHATNVWSESTVSWANFASAFDPQPDTSFQTLPGYAGMISFNATALAQQWVNGSIPNDGFLFEQAGPDSTRFWGSEHPYLQDRPKMNICFTTIQGYQQL